MRNSSGAAIWSTQTFGKSVNRAELRNDGTLTLLTSTGAIIWSTGAQKPADTVRPVILLKGSASISLVQGTAFIDPGASASDDVDGDISARIIISGTVNSAVVGNYTLNYNVKDAAGNAAITVSRTVTVTARSTENRVQLPIEVLGPAGTQKTVSFDINDPTGITHLYLRCNACGYQDIALDKNVNKIKAAVHVNGGPAIALKHFIENGQVYGNSSIRIIGGEALYGGIGGGFRTVRLTVPVSGLKKGVNTLTFEQIDREGPSIGFRIIELNLLQNGDLSRPVLTDLDFIQDDPAKWAAPRPAQSWCERQWLSSFIEGRSKHSSKAFHWHFRHKIVHFQLLKLVPGLR